jgi:hypothetical protein
MRAESQSLLTFRQRRQESDERHNAYRHAISVRLDDGARAKICIYSDLQVCAILNPG